jgi:hypothetical protein
MTRMISIEFRQEKTGSPVALVPTGDPATIPSVGDLVFVPDSEAPWIYAYFQVLRRQFFYDQQGALTMVSLTCEAGPAEHSPGATVPGPVLASQSGRSSTPTTAPHDPDDTGVLPGPE